MKDEYLEQLDAEIQYYCEQYYLNDGTDTTDMCTNIFCMMETINKKTTYIATHPERAKDHYNPNQDIPMIKELRRRLGFNQEQFADFIGVHRETVNRWENNKLPLPKERREQIEQLLEIYEAPKDSIFISFDERTSYEKIMQEINKETTTWQTPK